MNSPKKNNPPRLVAALMETFGFSPVTAFIVFVFLIAVGVAVIGWIIMSAPPRHITISSGPPGSTFERYALNYQRLLAARGIDLRVVPSNGSMENLQRLRNPKSGIDVALIQGGLTEGMTPRNLVSLGSVAYQPLWVFYRNATPIQRLSELAGKRICVGPEGTGARALAMTLLHANGITAENATLLDDDPKTAGASLQQGTVDAVFLSGDSAPSNVVSELLRFDGVQLFNWVQADAYVRHYEYLNKVVLPQGSIELGRNLPSRDLTLVGPTMELVVRKGMNSGISDALLDAASETHRRPGLLHRAGEFPAPLEHEFKLSDDAIRYYKNGKTFLYRVIPSFWIASMINPILVAVVPALLVLIPIFRILPILYRLRIHLRIYRCYRPLLGLERDAAGPLSPERARELLMRLDDIEQLVNRLKVPASFGMQFYELRTHIAFVRRRLEAAARPHG
jgi:TRAP-type uncharacterized transport system substrate-binding protein